MTRQEATQLSDGDVGVSAEVAILFKKAFGVKGDTLMRMEAAHAFAEARAREDEIGYCVPGIGGTVSPE